MKKIIYFLLTVLFIVGCSKDEPEPKNSISTGDPRIDQLINGGKLDNVFVEDYPYFRTVNDSIIFFSGQLKNSQKSGFIGFNLNTKEKLFDLIQFEHTSITIDLAYGEKETITVNDNISVNYYINNKYNSQIVDLKVNGNNRSVGYLYFIKDMKVTNIINPSDSNGYNNLNEIILWGKNFITRSFHRNILYNPTGNKLIDINFDFDLYTIFQNETINDFEAIAMTKYDIIRIDLRKKQHLWLTKLDISKLNQPRFDDRKLISKTDTHFTYEISYTEYNGNKGILKFKINIETGDIEYI